MTNEEIDIDEHEVSKFLLIFNTLIETINSQETLEETDGFVTDAILKIVNVISGLLKNNIDGLKVPEMIKTALKKLKSWFVSNKEEGKTGEAEPENAELSDKAKKADETSREKREEK